MKKTTVRIMAIALIVMLGCGIWVMSNMTRQRYDAIVMKNVEALTALELNGKYYDCVKTDRFIVCLVGHYVTVGDLKAYDKKPENPRIPND